MSSFFANFAVVINQKIDMKPLVSIIMGSTSDLPILEKTAKFLDSMEIPFEINALSLSPPQVWPPPFRE